MSTRCKAIATVMIVLTLLVGCGKAKSTVTPVPPTDTPVPPTATPLATSSGAQSDTGVKKYEEEPVSAALNAAQTEDDGYLLVGSTNHTHQNTAQEDLHVMKIDATGQKVWEKTFGGDQYDRGMDVVLTANGGFAILGETDSFGAGGRDLYLLQIDAEGNELWSQTFGGPEMERAAVIQVTTDGGYILVGATQSSGAGGTDVYLVRTDEAGNVLWSQTYGSENDDEGYSVLQTADGGFLVLGEKLHAGPWYILQDPDVYLLRTDGSGNEVWSQVWEAPDIQGGRVLIPTNDGNYIMTGMFSPTTNNNDMDFLLTKFDDLGNVIWSKPFGTPGVLDHGHDIAATSDGYLVVGLAIRGPNLLIVLVKTDVEGEVVWRQDLLEGQNTGAGSKVFETPDGGCLVIGTSGEGYSPDDVFDTIVIKTDAEGNVHGQ